MDIQLTGVNRARVVAVVASLLVAGCTRNIVPKSDPDGPAVTADGVLVFGSIVHVIDGEVRLPYGAFRPSIPAPHLDLVQIETGRTFQTRAVGKTGGTYAWRLEPGHYVIGGIGQGQFIDDHRITWPRLAFAVGDGRSPVYLGNLRLVGTSYAEPYTLSTGTKGVSKGIRYRFEVDDAMDRTGVPTGGSATKSLIFHRPGMPIGESLIDRLNASPSAVIDEIFRSQDAMAR